MGTSTQNATRMARTANDTSAGPFLENRRTTGLK
jgi:hypothetical protein